MLSTGKRWLWEVIIFRIMNIPVAMIFFNRPDQFRQIFNAVKQAKPNKLFLIQDGPRDNHPEDLESINLCRKVCEDIDWECEVYRNYSEVNLGCGKRVSSGITWAFNFVDRLMIFEDDTLPDFSWFIFCDELLERYRYDQRIGMITGVNHVGKYDAGGLSYFFATYGSIAGWATWKRVWDNYDYDVSYAANDYYMSCLSRTIYPKWKKKPLMKTIRSLYLASKNNVKRKSWSGPFGFSVMLNSQLIIVPSVNLITNIGVTPGATNGGTTKAIIPKKLQSIFDAPSYEMKFPLTHPLFVIGDKNYCDLWLGVMSGGNSCLSRFCRKIESYIRIIVVKYLKLYK